MPHISCQFCLQRFDAPSDTSFCPFCGARQTEKEGWIVGKRDLRRVARIQRTLLWFMLSLLALQAVIIALQFQRAPFTGAPFTAAAFLILYLGLLVTMAMNTIRLSGALGDHLVMRIIGAILMLAPCINLLLLVMVNQRATKALRKAGLRVGLMGVRDEDVVRFLGVNRCHGCGYNLTGNVSGRCPECGTPVGEAVVHAPPPRSHPKAENAS